MTIQFESSIVRKRPRRPTLLRILAGLLLIVSVFALKTMHDAGQFKRLQPHFSGSTRRVGGIVGGEDITIDHQLKMAYISADDRFARASGKNDAVGAIFALSLIDSTATPVEMQRYPEEPIAPHGISLVKGTDGRSYLYVVDHFCRDSSNQPKHRIILYLIEEGNRLSLVHSFEDESHLISPNDVVGLDEKRFYFTNDHGSVSQLGRMLEEYLQLNKSNVGYFDGQGYCWVATGIAMANGINISADGNEIYVAATIAKSIFVYDRRPDDGRLTQRSQISLNTGVDNIERDEHGNLWVGCHPKLLTFVRHSKDTKRQSPSQIFKLERSQDGNFQPKEIFLNEGNLISGSSVGAVSGNILLIGPVMDHQILWCELASD